MMVGHALLAFAVVATVADLRGWPARRALVAGAVAAAFATVPDADMVYAPAGVVTTDWSTAVGAAGAFWSASTVVHRAMTHSLVVAAPAAFAFAALTLRGPRRRVARLGGSLVLAALVAISVYFDGLLGGVVMLAFVLAGVAVSIGVVRYTAFSPRTTGVLAAFGLASHPFGDLFTGTPPELFYPLDVTVFAHRITLSADPTVHLLGAFGLELLVAWAALAVHYRLSERRLRDDVRWTAGLGVAYGVAVFYLPPPTLDGSYRFVFSILGVGAMLGSPDVPVRRDRWHFGDVRGRLRSWALTATAAVTLAWIAYAVGYVAA